MRIRLMTTLVLTATTLATLTTIATAAPDLKWEMKGDPIASEDGIAFQWTFSTSPQMREAVRSYSSIVSNRVESSPPCAPAFILTAPPNEAGIATPHSSPASP